MEDNSNTELNPSSESSSNNRWQRIFRSDKFRISLLSLLVIGLVTGGWYAIKHRSSTIHHEDNGFIVSSATPQGSVAVTQPKIEIHFSHPIDPGKAYEYVEFDPPFEFAQVPPDQTGGNVNVTGAPNQPADGSIPNTSTTVSYGIAFLPNYSLYYGQTYKVKVKKGLPSTHGETLSEDYNFSFSIGPQGEDVYLESRGVYGRVMSFVDYKPVDLTFRIGSEAKDVRMTVYKATDEKDILNELAKNDPTYGYSGIATYAPNDFDVSKYAKIKELDQVKDGQAFDLNGEKAGLYLVRIWGNGKLKSNVWVNLNTAAVHYRGDDQKAILAAQDLATGNPVNGIEYTFYRQDGSKWESILKGKIDASNGIQEFPFVYPKTVNIIVAKKAGEFMFIPVSYWPSLSEVGVYRNLSEKHQLFVYTDRPIYKPGDTVLYRGLVRVDNDALYSLPKEGEPVEVSFGYATKGDQYASNTVSATASVGPGGVFYGELQIPKDALPSDYANMTARLAKDPESYDAAYLTFAIADYIKPEFELAIKGDGFDYTRGDTVPMNIVMKDFAGKGITGAQVEYTVYSRRYNEPDPEVYNKSFKLNGVGGMCGGGFDTEYYGEQVGDQVKALLGKNGELEIKIDSKTIPTGSQEVTVIAERNDSNGNRIVAAKNVIVHGGDYIITTPGVKYYLDVNIAEGAQVPVKLLALNKASVANKTVEYKLVSKKWETSNVPQEVVLLEDTVTTNGNGEAVITIEKKDDYKTNGWFELVITAPDTKGNRNSINLGVSFYSPGQTAYSPAANTALNIVAPKNNYKVGQSLDLKIESPADIKALLTFDRGRLYKTQWVDLKKGEHVYSFPVVNEFSPSITPTFSLFYEGRYYIEGLTVNVPSMHKLINVDLKVDQARYKTGSVAIMKIKTTDSSGKPVSARVGVSVVDKAIFALRKQALPGLHSAFYFFRGRSTNASSSFVWIGGFDGGGKGGGGGDGALTNKQIDTLLWKPDLQSDQNGELTVEIPLGDTATTWKALVFASTDNDTNLGQNDIEFIVDK